MGLLWLVDPEAVTLAAVAEDGVRAVLDGIAVGEPDGDGVGAA